MNLFLSLSAAALFCTAAVSAQPNQYADFQRAIADRRSSAAYLEKIESDARTPNVPYTGTGIDHSAFYNNTVRRSGPPPLSAEAQKKLDEWLAKEQENKDRRVEAMLKRDAVMRPFANVFTAAGFDETEAENLTRVIVDGNGAVRTDYRDYLKNAEYYGYFKTQMATASFDELMLAISEFEYYAPGTAYEALQGLQTRFPEKEKQLDAASVSRLLRYFEGNAFTRTDNTNRYFPYTIKMADEYLKLEDKYPEIGRPFIAEIHREHDITNDPYQVKMDALWQERHKETKERKRLQQRYSKLR